MKTRLFGILLTAAFLVFAVPAFAGATGFNFGQFGNNVDIAYSGVGCTSFYGCVHFTNSEGFTLDITGFSSDTHRVDLYYKNGGCCAGTEVGLGLVGQGTLDNEINNPYEFLQLDIGKLAGEGASSLIIGGNSTTNNEAWGISYSNSDGTLVTAGRVAYSTGPGVFITVSTSGAQYLDFSSVTNSGGGNVLASSYPAPEPTSMLLLGSGLVTMGGLFRKKKKSV